jgi:hypothetical protein
VTTVVLAVLAVGVLLMLVDLLKLDRQVLSACVTGYDGPEFRRVA